MPDSSVTATGFIEHNRSRLFSAKELLGQLERIAPPFDETTVLQPLNKLLLELENVVGEANLIVSDGGRAACAATWLSSSRSSHATFAMASVTSNSPAGRT